jgi:hypothetical protein
VFEMTGIWGQEWFVLEDVLEWLRKDFGASMLVLNFDTNTICS